MTRKIPPCQSDSDWSEDKELVYSWSQFDKDVNQIVEWASDYDFNGIYGIPRGGLPLAVYLSHALDVPLILSRDDITNNTLIVDDIADTGDTLARFFLSLLIDRGSVKVATIFVREDTRTTPNFYCHQEERWVQFPWETESSSRYDGTV